MWCALWCACNDPTGPEAGGPNDVPAPTGFQEDRTGTGDLYVTDTFLHHIHPVDILMVIDNSGSMAEEQDLLDVNATPFLDFLELTGSDYHIGVVTTDLFDSTQSGRLQPDQDDRIWIDLDTEDPFTSFSTLVHQGIYGDGNEQGRGAFYMALSEPLLSGANAGFYRSDAMLIGIVLTDEPDSTPDSLISKPDFVTWASGLKENPATNLTFNSIVGPPGGCTYAYGGEDYIGLTMEIGGVVADICSANFNGLFDTMAASIPSDPLLLSEEPAADTIHVSAIEPGVPARTLLIDVEWVYDAIGNQITLLAGVAEGSEITVTYWPASAVGTATPGTPYP
jgi:hypothetical protein